MQNGGIKVVDMHRILGPMILIWTDHITVFVGQVVSIFIRLAISYARLDPTPAIQVVKARG